MGSRLTIPALKATAYVVEQAVIDALIATGVPLTNIMGGHHSDTHGLASVNAAIARLRAPRAPDLVEPTVMFVINRAWRRDMNDSAIYEATRGHWRIGKRARDQARYAFGVAFGIVRGVYEIDSWYAGTGDDEGRWGLTGRPARNMSAFVGSSVRHLVPERGVQNPVRLFLGGTSGVRHHDHHTV